MSDLDASRALRTLLRYGPDVWRGLPRDMKERIYLLLRKVAPAPAWARTPVSNRGRTLHAWRQSTCGPDMVRTLCDLRQHVRRADLAPIHPGRWDRRCPGCLDALARNPFFEGMMEEERDG